MKTIWHYHIFRCSNKGDMAIHTAMQEMIKSKLPHSEFKNYDLNEDELTMEKINELNSDGKAIIIGGSGLYINFYWKSYKNAFWYFPCDVNLFKHIKVPIILYVLGFNQDFFGEEDLSKEAKDSIRDINKLAVLSSVRDSYSLERLKELGVSNVELVPDPACFLESKKFGFEVNKNKLNMGLNLGAHTKGSQFISEKVFKQVVELLNYLKNKCDAEYYYFKHHDACRRNILKLKEAGIDFKVVDEKPKEMLYAYKQMDIMIGQMMHSTILAFNAGVPTINIAYNIKNKAFFDLIDKRELCLRGDKLDIGELKEKVHYLINNKDKMKKELRKKKSELLKIEENWLNKVCEVLK